MGDLTKKDFQLLERVFSAEIEAALGTAAIHLFQSKSKRMKVLEKEGYVSEKTITLEGRFAINITGWELTELGRITYCMLCPDPDEDSTKDNTLEDGKRSGTA